MNDNKDPFIIPLHTGHYLLSIARTDDHTSITISHTEHGHWAELTIQNADGEVIHEDCIDCRHPDVGIAFMISE